MEEVFASESCHVASRRGERKHEWWVLEARVAVGDHDVDVDGIHVSGDRRAGGRVSSGVSVFAAGEPVARMRER